MFIRSSKKNEARGTGNISIAAQRPLAPDPRPPGRASHGLFDGRWI